MNQKNSSKLSQYLIYGFLLSFFLIKLPPIYIVPLFHPSLSTSYVLFTFIVIAISITLVLKKEIKFTKKEKKLLIIFIIYFTLASLSSINAVSITDFFQSYKNVVIAGLFLFLTIQFREYYKKIIWILIFSMIITSSYQLFAFFSPNIFKLIGDIFIEQKHFNLVSLDLYRGRIFTETYEEIVFPLIFALLASKKGFLGNPIISMLLLLLSAIPSFISNFRTRIIMITISAFCSIFLLTNRKIIYSSAIIILGLFIIGSTINYLSSSFFGYSYFDRFLLTNTQDTISIVSRNDSINKALDMGIANPFFGVGLGNYYNHIPNQYKFSSTLNSNSQELSNIALQNPHNIFAQLFAETGFFSVGFYFVMLFIFLKSDISIFRKNKPTYQKAFIISFWTLFTYSLFNPVTSLAYNSLFWSFRALANYDKSTY